MDIKQILSQIVNSEYFIIGIAAIIILIAIVLLLRVEKIRKMAYKLFLQAETTIVGDGRGEERMDYVVSEIRSKLPMILQVFLTETLLRKLLQYFFTSIKDYLDDGIFNHSSGDLADYSKNEMIGILVDSIQATEIDTGVSTKLLVTDLAEIITNKGFRLVADSTDNVTTDEVVE